MPAKIACLAVLCAMASACLSGQQSAKRAESAPGAYGGGSAVIALDPPMSGPPERDDRKAPIVRVAVFGSSSEPVAVPYIYGYPLYADGSARDGVRLMRQDNWTGFERDEQNGEDGLTHVVEHLPALNCQFLGIQEDIGRYVPQSVECALPMGKERGGARPVVGGIVPGMKPAAVLSDPALAKAFLGEWHAKTPGFDSGTGIGYFDTPHGLLGFGFKNGRLSTVSFVFAATEAAWRAPELWLEPAGYSQ